MTTPPRWLTDLRPVGECRIERLLPGGDAIAWQVVLNFERWSPPPGTPKLQWQVTYGKTLIARNDGQWTVAEIELVRRLRAAGWQAGWLDAFGSAPPAWQEWLMKPELLPSPLGEFLRTTSADGKSRRGQPDIIARRDGSLATAVFVEYKGPGDKVRPGQNAWFRAALNAGMKREQFAVARWPGASVPGARGAGIRPKRD